MTRQFLNKPRPGNVFDVFKKSNLSAQQFVESEIKNLAFRFLKKKRKRLSARTMKQIAHRIFKFLNKFQKELEAAGHSNGQKPLGPQPIIGKNMSKIKH